MTAAAQSLFFLLCICTVVAGFVPMVNSLAWMLPNPAPPSRERFTAVSDPTVAGLANSRRTLAIVDAGLRYHFQNATTAAPEQGVNIGMSTVDAACTYSAFSIDTALCERLKTGVDDVVAHTYVPGIPFRPDTDAAVVVRVSYANYVLVRYDVQANVDTTVPAGPLITIGARDASEVALFRPVMFALDAPGSLFGISSISDIDRASSPAIGLVLKGVCGSASGGCSYVPTTAKSPDPVRVRLYALKYVGLIPQVSRIMRDVETAKALSFNALSFVVPPSALSASTGFTVSSAQGVIFNFAASGVTFNDGNHSMDMPLAFLSATPRSSRHILCMFTCDMLVLVFFYVADGIQRFDVKAMVVTPVSFSIADVDTIVRSTRAAGLITGIRGVMHLLSTPSPLDVAIALGVWTPIG